MGWGMVIDDERAGWAWKRKVWDPVVRGGEIVATLGGGGGSGQLKAGPGSQRLLRGRQHAAVEGGG